MPLRYAPNISVSQGDIETTEAPDVALIPEMQGLIIGDMLLITANWNRAVDEFNLTDLVLNWFDVTGAEQPANTPVGSVDTFTGMDGDRIYTFILRLPRIAGQVDIVVPVQAAVASDDDTQRGPLIARVLTVRYNNEVRLTSVPDVEITFPDAIPDETFVGERLITRFTFTESVGGFVLDDDVVLDTAGASISDLNQINDAGSIYEALLELPSNTNGDIVITVSMDSVSGKNATGPPGNRSVTLNYDSRPTQNRTASSNAGLPDPVLVYSDVNSLSDGIYNGVLEMHIDGDTIYTVDQLVHSRGSSPNDFPDDSRMARAELSSYDLGDSMYSVVRSYDYVTTAACYITSHNNDLYWFDGTHYGYRFNDNIDTEVVEGRNQRQYTWKGNTGRLTKLSGGVISEVGTWRSNFINPDDAEAIRDIYYGRHGGMASNMVSGPSDTGESSVLHLISGYGDLRNINDNQDDVTLTDNWQWLQLGERLNPRFDIIETNDRTGWQILEDIAVSLNMSIGFDVEQFFMRDANPPAAPVSEADADHIIEFRSPNVMQDLEDINFRNNEEYLYNTIKVRYEEETALSRDTDSITANSEIVLDVRTLLSRQQSNWAQWLANSFLSRFSTLHHIFNVELLLSSDIKVGDVIFFNVPGRAYINIACQVLEINHRVEDHVTNITCITID